MSSSNWLLSVGDLKAVSWHNLTSLELNLNNEIKYYFEDDDILILFLLFYFYANFLFKN